MLFAYKRFLELVNDTQNVKILYEYIENTMKAPIDTSDLLRWQWVQCISAFDKFVHDIVRIGMIDIFQGNRLATPKYNKYFSNGHSNIRGYAKFTVNCSDDF